MTGDKGESVGGISLSLFSFNSRYESRKRERRDKKENSQKSRENVVLCKGIDIYIYRRSTPPSTINHTIFIILMLTCSFFSLSLSPLFFSPFLLVNKYLRSLYQMILLLLHPCIFLLFFLSWRASRVILSFSRRRNLPAPACSFSGLNVSVMQIPRRGILGMVPDPPPPP